MTTPSPDAVAASTFRIGRKKVVATGREALARWAVQQGILPRAEGGTQLPPAERLAGLLEDPACALPLAALVPAVLVDLRARRLAALGSALAMLVEQAALAAAIASLLELQGLAWPHPLEAAAPDGVQLLDEEARAALRARATAAGLDRTLAWLLASGAGFGELASATGDAAAGWLALPGRRVELPAVLLTPSAACDSLAWVGFAAAEGLAEPSCRLTALTGRLGAGSHLDEAFILAGCEPAAPPGPLVPWLG